MLKRKKNTRQRGGTTHGWGAMKKHRGAGNRGGRGHAGSGKRGDGKRPSYWGIKHFYGGHGFTSLKQDKTHTINIRAIADNLALWQTEKKAVAENDGLKIELGKLGFTKLLSNGRVTKKLFIHVHAASPKAIEKVKAAGGNVVVDKTPEAATT